MVTTVILNNSEHHDQYRITSAIDKIEPIQSSLWGQQHTLLVHAANKSAVFSISDTVINLIMTAGYDKSTFQEWGKNIASRSKAIVTVRWCQ